MAKNTPSVTDGLFEYFDEYEKRITIRFDISQEPAAWLDMLKTLKSLRVSYRDPKTGFKFSYSCYKKTQIIKTYDKHGQKLELYQGSFWIAHKRIANRLNRIYIGKDANMTTSQLAIVAKEISQTKFA